VDARNLAEYEGKAKMEEMRTLRREGLGIGCDGVLARLALLIKKALAREPGAKARPSDA